MSSKPQRLFPVVTGAIFAGGESRRMGQSKEGIRLWDGRPMLAHIIDALAPFCEKIVVVGHCRGYEVSADPRLIQIQEPQPGLGPVAALEALLSSKLGAQYLVAACDQPLLRPALLQVLLNACPETLKAPILFKDVNGGELDPFPGLYPASLLPVVQEALTEGQFAIRKVLRRGSPIQWTTLPVGDEKFLINCNTPESLSELVATMRPEELAS